MTALGPRIGKYDLYEIRPFSHFERLIAGVARILPLFFLLAPLSPARTNEPNRVLKVLQSILIHRPPTVWELNHWFILGVIPVFLIQTLLIVGLLWQRPSKKRFQKRLLEQMAFEGMLSDPAGKAVAAPKIARDITGKKGAEQALEESEERFRLFMDHSPAVAWLKDEQGRYIYLSESYLRQMGVRPEDRLGKTDFEVYPPAIAEEFQKNDRAALALGYPIEVTEESMDSQGEPCTWLAYKFRFRDTSGQLFVGGIAIDVTERKKARESLQALTGRLISAQEEERARLARELHDDFSQRLALLGIGLGQLWKRLPSEDVVERQRVMEMLKGTKELMSDLHTLSHELHSSRLEHVGLVSALAGLCKEIGERHKIAVRFSPCESPVVPKDVALCLFRVTQEALGNVIKHSGAIEAQVELSADAGGIALRITDHGRGFDPSIRNAQAGIGLIGMTERLRLVGGRLCVTSQPDCGTVIFAEVPLAAALSEVQVKSHASGK
ncbi:MAG TPA: PAS domain-containing protein [Terriglobia bacterium]|nr:PAS domain-containing protein [Terriglobia bacterium]